MAIKSKSPSGKGVDVVRAMKDEEYRASLTDQQRATLPAHPVGEIENKLLQDAFSKKQAILVDVLLALRADRTTKTAYCSIKWC